MDYGMYPNIFTKKELTLMVELGVPNAYMLYNSPYEMYQGLAYHCFMHELSGFAVDSLRRILHHWARLDVEQSWRKREELLDELIILE